MAQCFARAYRWRDGLADLIGLTRCGVGRADEERIAAYAVAALNPAALPL